MPNQTFERQLIQDFSFEFYGDLYAAHLANDRQFYVRLADMCEGMGLNTEGQRQRINNDEAISDKLVVMKADTVYQNTIRRRDVAFLNIQALPYQNHRLVLLSVSPMVSIKQRNHFTDRRKPSSKSMLGHMTSI